MERQVTSLMAFLARYFFNLDEYTFSQFLVLALLAMVAFFKVIKLRVAQVQEDISAGMTEVRQTITEQAQGIPALLRKSN